MASVVIIKTRNTSASLPEVPNRGYFVVPKRRQDDFHVNPSQVVRVSGFDVRILLCTICNKFSSGKLLECKKHGHVVCEDCHGLIDYHQGCLFQMGPSKEQRCCSAIWNETPSKVLGRLLENLKYCCIMDACQEPISHGAWKTHLETCQVLQNFIRCPDVLCQQSPIAKTDFVSHCLEVHGIHLTRKDGNGRYYFDLHPSMFNDGPAIAMIIQHEDHLVYMLGKNDKLKRVHLAAFVVQRDLQWATQFKLLLSKHNQRTSITAALKINPPERDWKDVEIFGRSRYFIYTHLDNSFFDKTVKPKGKKQYRFELNIQNSAKIIKGLKDSTWEPIRAQEDRHYKHSAPY